MVSVNFSHMDSVFTLKRTIQKKMLAKRKGEKFLEDFT